MPETDTAPPADAAVKPAPSATPAPANETPATGNAERGTRNAESPNTENTTGHPLVGRSKEELSQILRSSGNFDLDKPNQADESKGDFSALEAKDNEFELGDPFKGEADDIFGDLADALEGNAERGTRNAESAEAEPEAEQTTEASQSTEAVAEPAQAEAEPEAETEEADKPDESEPDERKRMRVSRKRLGDRNFAILELAESENLSFAEAEARLFGKAELGTRDAETEAAPPKPEGPTVESLQTQIDEKKTARKKASQDFNLDLVADLSDEIAGLARQQERLQDRAERAQEEAKQSVQSQRVTAEEASMARAAQLYPALQEEESALGEAIAAEVARLETSNPAFFLDPEWPETVAAKIAARQGLAPSHAERGTRNAESTPKPTTTQTPRPTLPKAKSRPVPAPVPGTGVPAVRAEPDENTIREQIRKATPEELRLFLRNNGTKVAA